jgi:hypothetical protein
MNNSAMRGLLSQVKKFEDLVLKPYKRRQYSYNLQYLSRETLIGIIGKKAAQALLKDPEDLTGIKQLSPKDVIIGDYDFVPLGVTQTESKIIKVQQLTNFLNIQIKIEQIKPGTTDLGVTISKIWDYLGDGDNRMILPKTTDPELDPNIENLLLAQGGDVPVNINDIDDNHLMVHAPFPVPPEFMPMKIKHLKAHTMQKNQKLIQLQAKTQAQPGAPVRQQPNFAPKAPGAGAVPGVVNPPAGVA